MGVESGGQVLQGMNTVLSLAQEVQGVRGQTRGSGDAVRDAEAMAQVAEMDAADQARRERKDSKTRADELKKLRRRERSRSMAGLGASGVALSGSPLKVMEGRAVEDEMDYQSLLASGEGAANATLRSGSRKASVYRNRAGSERSAARDARTDYGLGMAESLLNAGSKLFSIWR